MIPLSKESTEFPSFGNIKTIAVLPTLLKFFEKIILTRLKLNIDSLGGLHMSQNGFKEGRSTLNNIDKLAQTLKGAAELEESYRK